MAASGRCGRRDVHAALLLAWWWFPVLAPPAAPPPAPRTWQIDPAQSQVQFSVRKFWILHAHGTFPRLRGSLRRLDTASGAPVARVDATLAVADLEMDSQQDRAGVLGPEFFDAARFPLIEFRSDAFPIGELSRGGTLAGTLTLHGESRPVSLTLLPSDCPARPVDCAIRLRGSIQRFAFGVDGRRGLIGGEVTLRMLIHLEHAAPPPAVPAPARS